MAVHLPQELEEFIEREVRSGRYPSTEVVVREALELLKERDDISGPRKDEIRKLIDEGWDQAERGELVDGDVVFDRIESELRALDRSA